MNRVEISKLIVARMGEVENELKLQYLNSKSKIGYFYLDDLLPIELANKIHSNFPKSKDAVLKKSLKEYKYVAFQMNKYDALLEEIIYAFHEQIVINAVANICNMTGLFSDESLYAGGLSLMDNGKFLNPHLDNSHDINRMRWRVMNLLYYVTPDWKLENGGNLELWQNGVKKEPTIIVSKFNRLAVMVTHQKSWHSVSRVNINKTRCCVSNYYFSDKPVLETDEFHVTSFRGRKHQKFRDVLLMFDNKLRMGIRTLFKKGVRKNPHQYKK